MVAARKKWPDIFTVMEGSTDRSAVLSATMPIVKNPWYRMNNSMLMKWLLPDATYYSGEFDAPLTLPEQKNQMELGIGVIVPGGGWTSRSFTPPPKEVCDILDLSARNWAAKTPPAHLQCPKPIARSLSCAPAPPEAAASVQE